MLNILEATVSADLMQFNIRDNLSVKPEFESDLFDLMSTLALKVLVKL